jgi:uncharacterized membrane protein (DUF4010 family)
VIGSAPAIALDSALGLAVALGGGLLIGLERERRKGRGPDREAAGIRSFALAALGGGIAQALQQPALVVLGALLVAALVAVAYWKSRNPAPGSAAARRSANGDPGLTTELALFVTYLVGVLAVQQPALGAGAAVVVAALLAAREKLHRFATRALSDAELHDALLLAALALVLLPLAPAAPLPWLAGLSPRTLLLMVVLILALQAAGHVALRLLGPHTGLALSGLVSGFVSSTATIASLGARQKAEPALAAPCAAGAVWSTAATWMQALLMLGALAPTAALALLPVAASGAAAAGLLGWLRLAGGARPDPGTAASGAARESTPRSAPSSGPLRLREALLVVSLLGAVSVLVGWAQQRFGDAGLLAGTALAALADAHAPVVALGGLSAAGQLSSAEVPTGVLVAVAANAVTRGATAFVAGGRRYGSVVAGALLLSTAAAAAVAALFR